VFCCSIILAHITTNISEANEVERRCGPTHSLAMQVRRADIQWEEGCTLHNPTVIHSARHKIWLQPPSTSFTLMKVSTMFLGIMQQHIMWLTPESQNYIWMDYNIVFNDVL
jgi:hypothetical protein